MTCGPSTASVCDAGRHRSRLYWLVYRRQDRRLLRSCTTVPSCRSAGQSPHLPRPCHATGKSSPVTSSAYPQNLWQVWADVHALPVPGCDGKTASEIFKEAGCVPPASPSCAACLGGPKDTFARMNEAVTCVSTTNRNFPGRMGHKEGRVYLASPYTAAASALKGKVCDPRSYLS